MQPEPPAVRIRNLRIGYGNGPDIVHGVDLTVDAGSTAAVLGPSGGGKSTILKAIAGLLPVRGGDLEVLGHPWPHRPPAGAVGYVPQRLGLVRHATVLQNALQGALHETPAWRSLLHRPEADLLDRALEAVQDLGLEDHAHVPVHRLSGGQQRRVATARALVQQPRLLLADEFLGELDPATVDAVLTAVQRLQRRSGMTLVLVEHHLDQALRVADRVHLVKGGRLTDALQPHTEAHHAVPTRTVPAGAAA